MIKNFNEDIIAALATPLGEAAIGIVRISGCGAVEFVESIFKPRKKGFNLTDAETHTVHLGYICEKTGEIIDEVLVCVMRAPRTYTREDIVEIYCHGGIIPVRRVLEIVLKSGARLAEPGEFTKRAFLNGRIDLVQAEAVLDLIRAKTDQGADLAVRQIRGVLSENIIKIKNDVVDILKKIEAELDFPEDVESEDRLIIVSKIENAISEIESILRGACFGRIYREGIEIVLLGKPNVGKSTLLNKILNEDRALVTDIPGTTRDLIEETINIKGVPVKIIDTAGIREHADIIEKLGIQKTKEAVDRADLVLAVLDASTGIEEEDKIIMNMIKGKPGVILINKIDVSESVIKKEDLINYIDGKPVVEISARFGWGQEELENAILHVIGAGIVQKESVLITRERHQRALERTKEYLVNAKKGLNDGFPIDCVAVDIWDALNAVCEITGEVATEDIINEIFSDFCIGK